MLSNLLLSVQLVWIGVDRNQIKGNMRTINLDHSQEDTGHCRGFSEPGICIWKMGKDFFTTVGSRQLPYPRGTHFDTDCPQSVTWCKCLLMHCRCTQSSKVQTMGQSTIKIWRSVQSAPHLFSLLLIDMSSVSDILAFSCAARSDDLEVATRENLHLANNLVFDVTQTAPDDMDVLQEEQKIWVAEWERELVCGYQSGISHDTNNAIGPFTQLPEKG